MTRARPSTDRTWGTTRFSLTRTLASKSLPGSGPPSATTARLRGIITVPTRSPGLSVSASDQESGVRIQKPGVGAQTISWWRSDAGDIVLEGDPAAGPSPQLRALGSNRKIRRRQSAASKAFSPKSSPHPEFSRAVRAFTPMSIFFELWLQAICSNHRCFPKTCIALHASRNFPASGGFEWLYEHEKSPPDHSDINDCCHDGHHDHGSRESRSRGS